MPLYDYNSEAIEARKAQLRALREATPPDQRAAVLAEEIAARRALEAAYDAAPDTRICVPTPEIQIDQAPVAAAKPRVERASVATAASVAVAKRAAGAEAAPAPTQKTSTHESATPLQRRMQPSRIVGWKGVGGPKTEALYRAWRSFADNNQISTNTMYTYMTEARVRITLGAVNGSLGRLNANGAVSGPFFELLEYNREAILKVLKGHGVTSEASIQQFNDFVDAIAPARVEAEALKGQGTGSSNMARG